MSTKEELLTNSENDLPPSSSMYDLLICPITHQIFNQPVLLTPASYQSTSDAMPATIEEEAYYRLTQQMCPITRIPIFGYTRNTALKWLVEHYLSEHPEEKENQYQLTADSELTFPSSSQNSDIESQRPIMRSIEIESRVESMSFRAINESSYIRLNFMGGGVSSNARRSYNTIESSSALTEETQSRPYDLFWGSVIQNQVFRLASSMLAIFCGLYITSSALGALILKMDVYRVCLSTALTVTLATLVALVFSASAALSNSEDALCIALAIAALGPTFGFDAGQCFIYGKPSEDNQHIDTSNYIEALSLGGVIIVLTLGALSKLNKSCCEENEDSQGPRSGIVVL
ncbi:MAG: hypothetical protein K0U37_03485 [Gammaproteobacteria bacterium]|nr:hypothetical protein [Gammaproteobacteria bacterium]